MYLSKQSILKALETLSNATPAVLNNFSAIQYFLATDMYYKNHQEPCNSMDRENKTLFYNYVESIVSLDDGHYFSSFKQLYEGDKSLSSTVSSNFFSGSSVEHSNNTSGKKFNYPKKNPLIYALDGKVYKEDSFYSNFSDYLKTEKERAALVIWLLRKKDAFAELSIDEFRKSLRELNTSLMVDTLIPLDNGKWKEILDELNVDCSDEVAMIKSEDITGKKPQISERYPHQVIYFGAPGTGKSCAIKEKTKGKSVIRTTFHPDSDYSTFVGAYKPTMAEEETQVVPVVVNSGISLQNKGTYKEKRIVYKFVMQAFIKAYLGAWKKYADADLSMPSALTFTASGARYTITGIDTNGISYNKKFQYPITIKQIGSAWNEIWKNGKFVMPTGRIPGRSIEQAVSQWIYDHLDNCTKERLEAGLDALKQEIIKSGSVVVKRGTQSYTFTPSENEDTFFVSSNSISTKNTLKEYYSGEKDIEDLTEIKRKLVEKLAEHDAESFENAWSLMTEAFKKNAKASESKNANITYEPQFLIIEEINRGNCAQIFGDLFQLLDRGKNGFSEYPIEADIDLQQEIERAFYEHKDYKLSNNIDVEEAVNDYTSNYDASLSEDIQHGRVLLLPPNLYIWATMNTSDQSLFPIDSAFKRRWDWNYIKITNGYKKDDNGNYLKDASGNKIPLKWRLETNDQDWWAFLKKINEIIASMTSSADKQLGYFFCKADNNGVISEKTFVAKVLFYLWNDVFKDYGFEDSSLFTFTEMVDGKEETKELTFPDFYDEDGENVNTKRVAEFVKNVMNWKKNSKESN